MPRAAAKPKTEAAQAATPTPDAADPLADLRDPVGDPDPATEQADSSTPTEGPKEKAVDGLEGASIELSPEAIGAAVAALHGDRYLATSLHRGGVCACQSLARKTLAVFEHWATIVQANESDNQEESTSE